MNIFLRWIKFNTVGAIGIVVQLSTLALLVHFFQMHYIAATVLAVETAILHNFVWHERWTWLDLMDESTTGSFSRLFRFHLTNGFTSLLGNVLLMQFLVGTFHLPVLVANLLAIATCSLVNFTLSHYWVFRNSRRID